MTPLSLLLASSLSLAADGVTLDLTEKGLTFKDDARNLNASLDLFFQPRYILQMSGDGEATDEDRLAGTGFRIRRLLFLSSGKITNKLDYTFRVNFASTSEVTVYDAEGASKSYLLQGTTLDDARVGYKVADSLVLNLGRFKVPYSGHYLVSTYDLAFPEVSMVSDGWKDQGISGYSYGRDTGFAATGSLAEKKVDYAVGVFSGDGGLMWPPDDQGYLVTARIAAAPMGEFKLADMDLKRGDFKVGFGANAGVNTIPVYDDQGASTDPTRTGRAGAEVRLGGKGLMVHAEGHVGMPLGETEGSTSNGAMLQATYVLADAPVSPGLRLNRVDPDMDATEDAVMAAECVLNYLLPMPKGKDRTNRRKVQVGYLTGMQEGQEGLLVHQVTLGAQVGL